MGKLILICGAYVHSNVGDRALRDAAVLQVRQASPGCQVLISGMDDPEEYPSFNGVRNIGSMRRWAQCSSTTSAAGPFVRQAIVSLICLLWGRGPHALVGQAERLLPREVRTELEAIRAADHMVTLVGAGPYIQGADKPGLGRGLEIVAQLAPVVIAQRMGVGVTFTPQSYGPFPGGWRTRLIRKALSRATVLVREDESMRWLGALQVQGQPVPIRAVDLAFTLPPRGRRKGRASWRTEHGVSEDTILVALTVRKCLLAEQQARFERELADFVSLVQAYPNHQLLLLPMATNQRGNDDDRAIQRSLLGQCKDTSSIIVLEADDVDARAVVAEVDYLIGTRFHSVIFALLERIPSIGLAYEQKTKGILTDLGLGEWAIDAAEMTAKLLAQQLSLLEQNREAFLSTLNASLPGYTERQDLMNFVAEAVHT